MRAGPVSLVLGFLVLGLLVLGVLASRASRKDRQVRLRSKRALEFGQLSKQDGMTTPAYQPRVP